MQWLISLDRRHRVSVAAAQEAGVRARFKLTRAQTDRSAWAFDAAGRRYAGAGAVAAALAAALGMPALLAIYQWLPVRTPADLAYRWVARNRRRLPGATPYCQQPRRSCPEP